MQYPRKRYGPIDYPRLMALLQMRDLGELQESCKDWVEEALASQNHVRESKWTESIAVGSEQFV
jgi:hypothetical protein